jgi:hypothetical protein
MTAAWWLAIVALPLTAQPKKLVNAQVDTRPAASGLEALFHALEAADPQPAWIAYTVPATRERRFGCDSYSRDGETAIGGGTVYLEAPAEALILYRVEAHHAERIRTVAPECDIDAGGVPVHWLTDVRPAESVALLSRFTTSQERLGDAVLSAIALHRDLSADAALEAFAGPSQPEWLRRKAVYWLGAARGHSGFEAVRRILAQDAGETLRERAIQGLAASREPAVEAFVIALARNDPSGKVRGQALSWLARRAGPQAVETVVSAAANDPERTVRRRAVWALREVPNGEGVPLLIQVAKNGRDQEVRKQAMMALSQVHDDRVLAFFEEVLQSKP